MKALRPYQQELMLKYYDSIKKGFRRPLIQSPTGSGKSILMMEILQSSVSREKPILMIAHKEELINQLQTHFIKRFGIEPTVIADRSRYKYNPENPYCVASIQGWMSRLNRGLEIPSTPHIILIDEAHHSSSPSYSTLIKHYQECHIVGFTATPYRIDGRGFKYLDNGIEGFDILIKGPLVLDLIEQGYLSQVKFFKADKRIEEKNLVNVGIKHGEYIQSQVEDLIQKHISPNDVVDAWMQMGLSKQTIVYPQSVALSKEYCLAFRDYGIAAAHIDANTSPNERKRILDDFRDHRINVLCQHSIVIEGVDIPDIECVQFVRATNSLNIWWQAIGRGMRPHPNKEHLIVIDHANNLERLPLITLPFEFFLEPQSLDPRSDGYCTHCPYCDHYFRKNTTDQSKFKRLNELNDLEKSILGQRLDQSEKTNFEGTKLILTGYFIGLVCPNCNQNFNEARYEENNLINENKENDEFNNEIFEDKSREYDENDIELIEIKYLDKIDTWMSIKEIARLPLSKVMRLAILEHKFGINKLSIADLQLFINDCQAKKGWLYYIQNGTAMESKYFQNCLAKVKRNNQKQDELQINIFDFNQ